MHPHNEELVHGSIFSQSILDFEFQQWVPNLIRMIWNYLLFSSWISNTISVSWNKGWKWKLHHTSVEINFFLIGRAPQKYSTPKLAPTFLYLKSQLNHLLKYVSSHVHLFQSICTTIVTTLYPSAFEDQLQRIHPLSLHLYKIGMLVYNEHRQFLLDIHRCPYRWNMNLDSHYSDCRKWVIFACMHGTCI